MSFQAYLDNIQAKTGMSPDDFRKFSAKKGFIEGGSIKPGVKASEIVAWLKKDYSLGHGHAMAIVALLKGRPHQDVHAAARDHLSPLPSPTRQRNGFPHQ